jgi:small GTP-binding protein
MVMQTLQGPIEDLRTRTIALQLDLAGMLKQLGQPDLAHDAERLLALAEDLREMFFLVAIVGEFNSGKSTLINALLGDELLPTGITPTTEYVELVRNDEKAVRKPDVQADGALRVWAHPHTGAKGVALVDTPGTGSVFRKHERIAMDFLHRSDLVIFVISAKRAFSETERLYLQLARDYGKKTIVVVNQIDLLAPAELQTVRRFIDAQIREQIGDPLLLFTVSARNALLGEPDSGIEPLKAHLRGLYQQVSPAVAKLLAQVDTTERILNQAFQEVDRAAGLAAMDIAKVQDVQSELKQQSDALAERQKAALAEVDAVLETVRRRGDRFIRERLSANQVLRGVRREQLQAEFESDVVGRSLSELSQASNDYINAVVDQSRLYWRSVIERLNALRDLIDREVTGLDAGVYSQQRESLQRAIEIAEAELKAYRSGQVVRELEERFNANVTAFRSSALLTVGGVVAALIGVLTPGPVVGVGAAPLALPVLAVGLVAAAAGSVPTVLYLRRINREARDRFDERMDALTETYHTTLADLTGRERSRLTAYGEQMVTPIISRLEVLAQKYARQRGNLAGFQQTLAALRDELRHFDIPTLSEGAEDDA